MKGLFGIGWTDIKMFIFLEIEIRDGLLRIAGEIAGKSKFNIKLSKCKPYSHMENSVASPRFTNFFE